MENDEKQYCTIYLVRHGETENNAKEIIQGHLDSPLTEAGVRQAEELAEHLTNIEFDAVFSSDIGRAKRTAELASINKKLAVNTTELLRERNFGSFEGKTYQEYRLENEKMLSSLQSASWEEARKAKLYDDYETTEEMLHRIQTFLREVAVTYAGKQILVVSHGAIIAALLAHLDLAERGAIWINNAGYVVLKTDGIDFFLEKTHNVQLSEVHRILH